MRAKPLFLVLGGLCLIVVTGLFYLERLPLLAPLKTALQGLSVPSPLLNNGKMGKILRHNNLVLSEPNDFTRYPFNAEKDQLIQKTKAALEFRLRDYPQDDLAKSTFIRIELKTPQKGRMQVFWANKNEMFSHTRSKVFDLVKRRFLHILIDDLKDIRRLRIDPMEQPGISVLKTLTIYREGYQPICYFRKSDFQLWHPNKQLTLQTKKGSDELRMVSSGTDPFFSIDLLPQKNLFSEAVFQNKRGVGKTVYTVNPHRHGGLESSQALIRSKKEPFPTLSIAVKDEDLYDPQTGIIANFDQRGRKWERSGTVSFFEEGRLKYGAKVGLRLHGGRSRNKDYHSFRLYFRKEYGIAALAPGVLSGLGLKPIKTLVVHATKWPPRMPYNTLLAYDIVKRIGGLAPDFKLVELYFNGKNKGLYFITPHQGRRQIRAELGHDDFEMYRFKSNNSLKSEYMLTTYLWENAYGPAPLTTQLVEHEIDIDLFTRHLLSIIYCGTSDNCQGTALVNTKAPNPRLYWINWDMDHSFVDFAFSIKNRLAEPRPVWEQTGWKLVYRNSGYKCGKSQLFSRLMNEDPAYRKYVADLTLELLNHFIDQRFISDRLQYYRGITETRGEDLSDYFKMLEDFFEHRPEVIRREMAALFKIPPILPLNITSLQPFAYRVDGHTKQHAYSGWYLEQDEVELALSPDAAKHFSHWQVNGKSLKSSFIKVQIREPLKVEIVWKQL